ncbi:hypothetical protein GQ55_9G104900 [Panicum hallii var. hallii]|uniref:Uncharacterized protein n=1 Tax=Panicum hallii var. hallii TaxID=1504633 RepID=A0A2T7C1Q3_9POAL|nr:hypothetical protein GQ55_9G104900 [Panicum hallii var. hallii]
MADGRRAALGGGRGSRGGRGGRRRRHHGGGRRDPRAARHGHGRPAEAGGSGGARPLLHRRSASSTKWKKNPRVGRDLEGILPLSAPDREETTSGVQSEPPSSLRHRSTSPRPALRGEPVGRKICKYHPRDGSRDGAFMCIVHALKPTSLNIPSSFRS